jgi:hypothetical protein
MELTGQIASQHTTSFDKLLSAYARIAESLPRFDRYSRSFSDPDFQSVLALVYADIVEFHRRAYKFFRRKGESPDQRLIQLIVLKLGNCCLVPDGSHLSLDSMVSSTD